MAEELTCRGCGTRKTVDEFPLRSRETGAHSTLCRPCTADYQHRWYMANRDRLIPLARARRDRKAAENRVRAWLYLGDHPCVDCGETDPVVLEFDHIRDKKADVSELLSAGLAWETVEREIAKCEVRCANCHVRRTMRQIGVHDRKHAFRRVEDAPLAYSLMSP